MHFAYGLSENGQVHAEFARLVRRLAGLGGCYVPVAELLDHLRASPGWTGQLDQRVMRRMQWRWLLAKLRHGTS